MPRREFTAKTKGEAFLRAGGLCEGCGLKLRHGEAEYHHMHEAELGGCNGLANCRVLCRACHRAATNRFLREKAKGLKAFRARANAKARKGPPMPGSRASGFRKRMDGTVERRT